MIKGIEALTSTLRRPPAWLCEEVDGAAEE